MRRISFLILWVSSSLMAASTATDGFQVITYNTMQLCAGPECILKDSPDRDRRLTESALWLKRLGAEVVFLQEVFRRKDYQRILNASEYPYGIYFSDFSEQAILSKYPISESKFFPFRWQASKAQDCKRLTFAGLVGLGLTKLTLPEGEIYLASIHGIPRWPGTPGFPQGADYITPERKANLLEALQYLWGEVPRNSPLIFAGDFNMNQKSDEYPFFFRNSGLVDTYRLIREIGEGEWHKDCTFCGDNEYARADGDVREGVLDYIMVSKGSFDILASRILAEGERWSDHRAVQTKLRLLGSFHGFDPPLPSRFDLESLRSYFEEVALHPWCWITPTAWWQRGKILGWIEEMEKFVKD